MAKALFGSTLGRRHTTWCCRELANRIQDETAGGGEVHMIRREGTSGVTPKWISCAAFLVGFVFIGQIHLGLPGRVAVSMVFTLAATVYVLWLFFLDREGGLAGRLLRDSLALGGAFFLLVNYSPAVTCLARPLLMRPAVGRADLVVVLGSGVNPDGSLTTSSLERTLYAVELYRRGLAPWVLFSGGATEGMSQPSGQAMAGFARAIGLPRDATLVETASANTYEEALETARLMHQRGFQRALLVTDPTHMYRSHLVFRRQGAHVLPAPTRTREELRYVAGGPLTLFYAILHEYGGLVYYKIRGRI